MRGSSSGSSLLFSCQGCNEVWLPRLASVIGERLFKLMRIRTDVRPDHPNQDGSAMKWLLIEKLAAPIDSGFFGETIALVPLRFQVWTE
jgi:hypothetical protein